MVQRVCCLVILVVAISLGSWASSARALQADRVAGLDVVATHDLAGRGMNAGLAMAGDCAYAGSRSSIQDVLILDVSDPRHPSIAGSIPHHPGSTPRELRASAALRLLVIMHYRLDPATAAPNRLDFYDISDCWHPVLQGSFDFGDAHPHEFFLWHDPSPDRRGRALAFVAMWGHMPNLRVIDVTQPASPVELTTWDAGTLAGLPSRLHSLTVARDGRRAFLADWDLGFMILDTSSLAIGQGDLTPRLLTPPDAWIQLPGGNLHSAVVAAN
ncbi:MAG: hypothetical protein C4346_14085 [Chloroflexota bacterium]